MWPCLPCMYGELCCNLYGLYMSWVELYGSQYLECGYLILSKRSMLVNEFCDWLLCFISMISMLCFLYGMSCLLSKYVCSIVPITWVWTVQAVQLKNSSGTITYWWENLCLRVDEEPVILDGVQWPWRRLYYNIVKCGWMYAFAAIKFGSESCTGSHVLFIILHRIHLFLTYKDHNFRELSFVKGICCFER